MSPPSLEIPMANVKKLAKEDTFSSRWMVVTIEDDVSLFFGMFLGTLDRDAVLGAVEKIRSDKAEQDLAAAEKVPAVVVAVAASGGSEVGNSPLNSSSANISRLNLPAGEYVMDDFECWLFSKLDNNTYLKGRLLLFPNFVSFDSENLFFTIPLSNITFFTRDNTMIFIPNGLHIVTHVKSFFVTFTRSNRNKICDILTKQWTAAKKRADIVPQPRITSRDNPMRSVASTNQMQISQINAYMTNYGSGTLMMRVQPQLRSLCRAGIPDKFRCMFWQSCSGSIYKRIVEGDHYLHLLQQIAGIETQSTMEVEKDVRRSMPEHPLFQTDEGINSLRNVLTAYSFRNPKVGYAQGMNLITSLLLIHMSEEEAYFLLCTICEDLVPNFYRRSLIGAMVEQQIFNKVIATLFPRLHKHFDSCGFEIAIVSQAWFLCLFVGVLNYDASLNVLDAFFEEGAPLLLRVGAALVRLNEERLYEARDVAEFVQIFQVSTSTFTPQQIFTLVQTLELPDMSEFRQEKHLEMVKAIQEKAKKQSMALLEKRFKRFTWFELEHFNDEFVAFMRPDSGGEIDFVIFQKLLPIFYPGFDIELLHYMFSHLSEKKGTIGVERFVYLLDILIKAPVDEKWMFFWRCFEDEQQCMQRKRFRMFISCMTVVMFQVKTERGLVFQKSRRMVEMFCDSLIGKEENASINFDEAATECIRKDRLNIYFKSTKPTD